MTWHLFARSASDPAPTAARVREWGQRNEYRCAVSSGLSRLNPLPPDGLRSAPTPPAPTARRSPPPTCRWRQRPGPLGGVAPRQASPGVEWHDDQPASRQGPVDPGKTGQWNWSEWRSWQRAAYGRDRSKLVMLTADDVGHCFSSNID